VRIENNVLAKTAANVRSLITDINAALIQKCKPSHTPA
jgi:hypothetical protein